MDKTPQIRPVNLVIVAKGNSKPPRAVGKISRYRGRWVLHSTVKSTYRHVNTGAWGVREPLILCAERLGVKDVYLYNTDENETYHSTVETVRTYGTEGKTDSYGKTLNLPDMYWSETIPGRIALDPKWIPDMNSLKLPALAEAGLLESA